MRSDSVDAHDQDAPARGRLMQRVSSVLWPAFLVAAIAELGFFAVFDPVDLHAFGAPLEADRRSVYTIGFFFFWVITAAASALTLYLQKSEKT